MVVSKYILPVLIQSTLQLIIVKMQKKPLVVVDSRSDQWEKLSIDLDDGTNLFILDEGRSGIEQLNNFLAQTLQPPHMKIYLLLEGLLKARFALDQICLNHNHYPK